MSAGLGGEPVTPHYKNKEVWLSWRGTPAALMSLLVCAAIRRGGNGPESEAVKALLGCTLVVLQKVTLLLTGENNWLHYSAMFQMCIFTQ